MKKAFSSIVILSLVCMGFGQGTAEQIKLGLFSAHPFNHQYIYGKVKEVHYRTFHITDEDGKIVKGKPFTFQDADGVISRQQRSYYFNELGQMVKTAGTVNPNTHWTGVVHYDNDRIENIYWLRNDTLMFNWDIVYLDKGIVERHWISIQNNKQTGNQVIILDKDGNVVKQKNFNAQGELTYKNEFTRNADGTLKTQKGINAEGETTMYISDWKTNDMGQIISSFINILGGEEVNQKSKEVEYEYDDFGNWIKRFSRGEMLTERTIKYFD